ncbi:uncharacterized protein LOC129763041 isoform X3 [Toxorhynchites rutilus septentrionalis]|uniref:uncharacterized protein LOC129763041 isoform X3 n=1 Tax=Toxorhynchites rutilus septentrionalis TaxID=329112 RepID=UPI00247ADCE2|nr:uncharacterized protein LOC129763041 isoform X3 [Toxorhynchites rutilus septentrionalis]
MLNRSIGLLVAFIQVLQWFPTAQTIDPKTFVGSKLDVLSVGKGKTDVSDSIQNLKQVISDISEHQIVLKRSNIRLNYTSDSRKMLLTRTEKRGSFYIFIENEIQRITIYHDVLHVVPIAQINDIKGVDGVDEFEVEEFHSHANKTYLIVCVHLKDRFQIYQILQGQLNDNKALKSIQKIRRRGQSIKTFLVEHESNLYLITSYLESNAGKVEVYRWLNFHFSLEDIKDVPRHDGLIVHSNKQLVILVVRSAVYPERAMNHIYVMNENRKFVKTQEMYFLFNRLPFYRVNSDLYILRCLASDKCFLYKWNRESLFIRVSKIGFDPRNIDYLDSRHSIIVISSNNVLYFFYKQPLLKATASYVSIDHFGNTADIFPMNNEVSYIYIYKESDTGKLYLCIIYKKGEMEFIELQLNEQREADVYEGDPARFNALKTCLMDFKNTVNLRKIWTDLIRYHMKNVLSVCQNTFPSHLMFTKNLFAENTNIIKQIFVNGFIKDSPSVIHQEWNALRKNIHEMLARSRNLIYLNRANTMESDFKIMGNLHTNKAQMHRITIQRPESHIVRNKRHYRPQKKIAQRTINVKEFKHNGTLFKDILLKKKPNHASFHGNIRNMKTSSVNLKNEKINGISMIQTLFNTNNGNIVERGRKIFQAIDTKNIKTLSVNDHLFRQQFANLRSVSFFKTRSDSIIQLSGIREATTLNVDRKMNNILILNLMEQLYYTNKALVVAGNIQLQSCASIRNVLCSSINSRMTNILFDLKTNQSVFSSMHMFRVHTTALNYQLLNGHNIGRNAASTKATKFIEKASVSNFVVIGDLALSAEARNTTRHVLGTNIEDFFHIYTGRVLLKGSLTLNNLKTSSRKNQSFVRKFVISSIEDHFWMKKSKQNINNIVFLRPVQTTQLLCVELNYNDATEHLKKDNWHTNTIVNLLEIHISGNMQSHTPIKTFLKYIDSGIVRRESISKVFGYKIFTSSIDVDILITDNVNLIHTGDFMTRVGSVRVFRDLKHIGNLEIDECFVGLLGTFVVEYLHGSLLQDIIDYCVNSRDIQRINQITLLDMTAKYMNAHLINESKVKHLIRESNFSKTSIDTFAKLLKVDNLVIDGNIIITNQIIVEYLNLVNIKEYFILLAQKDQDSTLKNREIGGSKMLPTGSAVDAYFFNMQLNDIIMNNFLHDAVRISIHQNIIKSWFFNIMRTEYITTKQVNDVLTNKIVEANSREFKIQQDVAVKTLVVSSNSQGNIITNISDIRTPLKMKMISTFLIHGAYSQQHNKKGTVFLDIIISSVTSDYGTTEGKIVLHGDSTEIQSATYSKHILNKNCDFLRIIKDSVRHNQRSVTFIGRGRVYHNVIARKNVLSIELKSETVNGVNLNRLDISIHNIVLQQDQYIINTNKYFEFGLQLVRLITHDKHFANLYPPNKPNQSNGEVQANHHRFEALVMVTGDVFIGTINNFPLQDFLSMRVIKNHSISQVYMQTSQQITGNMTFSLLVFYKNENIIQTINRILVSEIITETLGDHQIISGPKWLLRNLFPNGPTSVKRCNGYYVLDTYKSSYLLHDEQFHSENIIFIKESIIQQGISARILFNNNSVKRMMGLRFLPVENLFPLIPSIRELIFSRRSYQNAAAYVPYIENTVDANEFRSTFRRDSKEPNGSDNIIINEVYINEVKQLNLTIRFKNQHFETESVSHLIIGRLEQVDWAEITYKEMKQRLVLLLIMEDGRYVLNLFAHKDDGLIEQQAITSLSSFSKFQLVQHNSTSTFMTLSQSIEVPPDNVVYKIQLFYYDVEVMRFVHFQTMRDYYRFAIAVALHEKVMLIVAKTNSNVLMVMELVDNVLYQKIMFHSNVASVEVLNLEDSVALKTITMDDIVHVYVHVPLEDYVFHLYTGV